MNYEKCDCADGHRGACDGPAVFEVTRNGEKLKLCTRCDFTEDKPSRRLIIDDSYPPEPLIEYDALGALVVLRELVGHQ